eukprot:m.121720 g.121720  ORF g.121720 m.121720 type:complete len:124 (-) comp52102_c0_seq1:546-917(-)
MLTESAFGFLMHRFFACCFQGCLFILFFFPSLFLYESCLAHRRSHTITEAFDSIFETGWRVHIRSRCRDVTLTECGNGCTIGSCVCSDDVFPPNNTRTVQITDNESFTSIIVPTTNAPIPGSP